MPSTGLSPDGFSFLGQTSQLDSLHETAKAALDKSTASYPLLGRHLCPSSIDACRLLNHANRPHCLLFAALSSSSTLEYPPVGHLLHMSLYSSCTQNCSQPTWRAPRKRSKIGRSQLWGGGGFGRKLSPRASKSNVKEWTTA